MSKKEKKMRWGVEQRLEFIEFRVFWENGLNRGDIVDFFDVSVPQASNDLKMYQELAPKNLRYDTRLKRYFASDSFAPKFMVLDAANYLSQLNSIDRQVTNAEETWISELPAFSAVAIPRRVIDPLLFQKVLSALRSKVALEIQYQSFSKPDPSWRTISPHAFGFDGMRWHTRAFCHHDEVYKDFLLSRILGIGDQKTDKPDKNQDHLWENEITVELVAHPNCSEGQRKAVELDYNMDDGIASVTMRHAMLFYFLKRQGFLKDGDTVLSGKDEPPKQQHVVLSSVEQVQILLNHTKQKILN